MFWGSVIIDNYGLQLVSMVYNDYQFFYRHYKFNEMTGGEEVKSLLWFLNPMYSK